MNARYECHECDCIAKSQSSLREHKAATALKVIKLVKTPNLSNEKMSLKKINEIKRIQFFLNTAAGFQLFYFQFAKDFFFIHKMSFFCCFYLENGTIFADAIENCFEFIRRLC